MDTTLHRHVLNSAGWTELTGLQHNKRTPYPSTRRARLDASLPAARLTILRTAIEVTWEALAALNSLEFQLSLSQRFDGQIDFYESVRNFEISLIKEALNHAGGIQIDAASLLGLKASTLNAKMKAYDLRPGQQPMALVREHSQVSGK